MGVGRKLHTRPELGVPLRDSSALRTTCIFLTQKDAKRCRAKNAKEARALLYFASFCSLCVLLRQKTGLARLPGINDLRYGFMERRKFQRKLHTGPELGVPLRDSSALRTTCIFLTQRTQKDAERRTQRKRSPSLLCVLLLTLRPFAHFAYFCVKKKVSPVRLESMTCDMGSWRDERWEFPRKLHTGLRTLTASRTSPARPKVKRHSMRRRAPHSGSFGATEVQSQGGEALHQLR